MKVKIKFCILFVAIFINPYANASTESILKLLNAQTSAQNLLPKDLQQQLSMGNEGAHGGDIYANEFVALGNEILAEISKAKYQAIHRAIGLDVLKLANTLRTTEVYSEKAEVVKKDGISVSALNFPDLKPAKILINRDMWILANLGAKLKLILHEYFGILKLEQDVYNKSIQYKDALYIVLQEQLTTNIPSVRYYGQCMASPPLAYVGEACVANRPAILHAIDCAKRQAEQNCIFERGNDCESIKIHIKQRNHGEKALFLKYCEVTALAR